MMHTVIFIFALLAALYIIKKGQLNKRRVLSVIVLSILCLIALNSFATAAIVLVRIIMIRTGNAF